MVTGHLRGHPIEYLNKQWVYSDNKVEISKEKRRCVKCNCYPTVEGYDACIGYIEGAIYACCGHGIQKGYIIYEDGRDKEM